MSSTRVKILSTVFLLLLICGITAAQSQKKIYKILGIAVEGNKYADASTIIATSGLKVDDEIEIPGDQTIGAIKKLWGLNIFSDVQILVDKVIQNGAFIVIKVEEYPRIEGYSFEGNDKIKKDDIDKKINLTRGQVLKPQEVFKIIRKIQSLYEEEGYLFSEIKPVRFKFLRLDSVKKEFVAIWASEEDTTQIEKSTYDAAIEKRISLERRLKDRVWLKFFINENDRAIVRAIEFEGNNFFDDDDLRSEFDNTIIKKWWKFWRTGKLVKTDYEKDKQKLKEFYRKNGFRDFEIIKDTFEVMEDKRGVKIFITVYEGPQYKIRNIKFEGNTIYSSDVLMQRLGFSKGDIYDYEKFNQNLRGNKTQTDVASLYLDNGYLTFNLLVNETKVPPDSIDVNIKIIENNRFKIGLINVAGNTKTKEKVIRRELFITPGDYFNRSLLLRSLQQLANLQYFKVEKLYTEGIDYNFENDSLVSVTVKVEEKSSDYLNASIGYSGSFGFSGMVGITLTNFSIAEPFSLGGGQILNFNWQFGVGKYYRTFTIGFTEPWFMDTPTLIGFEIFDTRQSYYYTLAQTGGTIRFGRRLTWPDDFFGINGFFRYQRNDVRDGGGFYEEGKSQQYTLGITFYRRDIDNPIFPSQGSNVSLDAEVSGGPFLPGNVDFWKTIFSVDLYKRLFNTNRVAFYTSAQWGFIDEFRSETKINFFEYFFMGGNGMVIATIPLRGYDDRTVGPRNLNRRIIGGRAYAKYTSELRFAATFEPMPIYFLMFAEAGNVFERIKYADFFDLKKSVGVGARLLINPIGLIGFDFGYGFDKKDVDGGSPRWIFHFQFGKGF